MANDEEFILPILKWNIWWKNLIKMAINDYLNKNFLIMRIGIMMTDSHDFFFVLSTETISSSLLISMNKLNRRESLFFFSFDFIFKDNWYVFNTHSSHDERSCLSFYFTLDEIEMSVINMAYAFFFILLSSCMLLTSLEIFIWRNLCDCR